MAAFEVIVPVYNRPGEVEELLESLCSQSFKDFGVIIVEDGSTLPCKDVVERYRGRLDVKYFVKPNGGPGLARNYGAAHASAPWLIILDSDVILPEDYFEAVRSGLAAPEGDCDAFGGPDRAHSDFTSVQKAINYSMTSFLTTGGIRGGKVKVDKFYPRSFNLGIKTEAYRALGGFSEMRFGEDIDLSIRIFKAGYRCRLLPEAWVWHKRRTNLRKFFHQVHNFGMARITLYKKYPESLKLVHMLPALFTLAVALIVLGALACSVLLPAWTAAAALSPLALWALAIFTDSTIKSKNPWIGLLSIAASFIQLIGYGSGFIRAWWKNLRIFTKTV